MGSHIRERYPAKMVEANTDTPILNQSIGGFICTADGTISITNSRGETVLSSFPVTAGVYYPIPIFVGFPNAVFTTAGGAAGSLLA